MVIRRHAPPGVSFRKTFRASRVAIAWSVFMALPFIVVGYAQNLIIFFLSFNPFLYTYATHIGEDGEPSIHIGLIIGLQLCIVASSMIGALLAGWLSGKCSPRKLMACALLAFLLLSKVNITVPILSALSAPGRGFLVFLIGTFLQGIPLGMIGTVAMNYVADICPRTISDILLAYITMCWALGMTIAAGILWGMSFAGGPFVESPLGRHLLIGGALAVQWLIPIIVLIGLFFAPESPWWLVREGRHDDATRALEKLRVPDVPQRLAEYQALCQTETQMHVENTYADCFKRSNRRRTEIALMTSLGQLMSGFVIVAQAILLLNYLGLTKQKVLMMIFISGCVLLAGQLLYFALHAVFTFRVLYIAGLCLICPILLSVGVMEALNTSHIMDSETAMWTQVYLIVGWSFVYGATLNAATPAIVCDASASTLRIKTIALSRGSYDFVNLIQTGVGGLMVSPQYGDMKGFVAFLPAGFCIAWLVWCFLRLPEVEGVDPQIVDFLFEKQVPTTQFPQQAARVALGLELTAGPHAGLRREVPGDTNPQARPAELMVEIPPASAPEVMEIHLSRQPSMIELPPVSAPEVMDIHLARQPSFIA